MQNMQNKVTDHKKTNKDKSEFSRLEELARSKPNLFLIVLDFTENDKIIPLFNIKGLCKNILWEILLIKKYPYEFRSRMDIRTKYDLMNHLPDVHTRQFINEEEEKEVKDIRKKALKCFFYSTVGWTRVVSALPLNRFTEDEIHRQQTLNNYTPPPFFQPNANPRSRDTIKLNDATVVISALQKPIFVCDVGSNTWNVVPAFSRHIENWHVTYRLNDHSIVVCSREIMEIWDLSNIDTIVRIGMYQFGQQLSSNHCVSFSVFELNKTTIVSCGLTAFCVWNLNDTKMVNLTHPFVYSYHDYPVNDGHQLMIKFNETTVVSACGDFVFVWDLADLANISVEALESHTRDIDFLIKLNDTTIVSGSRNGELRVWMYKKALGIMNYVYTWYCMSLECNGGLDSVMKLNDTTIVTTFLDGVLIYDLEGIELKDRKVEMDWGCLAVARDIKGRTIRFDTSHILNENTNRAIKSVMRINDKSFVTSCDKELHVWKLEEVHGFNKYNWKESKHSNDLRVKTEGHNFCNNYINYDWKEYIYNYKKEYMYQPIVKDKFNHEKVCWYPEQAMVKINEHTLATIEQIIYPEFIRLGSKPKPDGSDGYNFVDPTFNELMVQDTRLRVWHSIVPEWTNSNNLATYSIHNWRQRVHVISHSDSESSSDSHDTSEDDDDDFRVTNGRADILA